MLAGIDIGGTKCAVVKGDKSGRVTGKVSFATAGCRETLERIYKEIGRLTEVTAIGISCGRPLDEKQGVILSPPNLPGWDEVHIKEELSPVTVNEIEMSGIDRIPASVPGNFELDLMKQGLLPDLYIGDNILKARRYEGTHIWYYTEFELKGDDCQKCLCFDGIDTTAEIFIDGSHMLSAENMFTEYKIPLDSLICGRHEVVVHITPACVAERAYELPPMCRSLRYQRGGLSLRKAAYMYGWDIMPRLVSAGLCDGMCCLSGRPSYAAADIG